MDEKKEDIDKLYTLFYGNKQSRETDKTSQLFYQKRLEPIVKEFLKEKEFKEILQES